MAAKVTRLTHKIAIQPAPIISVNVEYQIRHIGNY
jgi:hypothetical protein